MMERQSLTLTIFVHIAALVLAIVILAPVAWLFVMSISSTPDLLAKPLHWWPGYGGPFALWCASVFSCKQCG